MRLLMYAASVAGLVSLLIAAPAAALTYTETFAAGEGTGLIDLTSYPDGTDFNFVFTTTSPVISGTAAFTYESGFDQYFDVSGVDYGGDNEPNELDTPITSSYLAKKLVTPNDYSLYYPDGDLAEHDYFQPLSISVDVFVPDASNGQTFTFSVTPAPEPATWALYTLGAALIGGVIRRRRRATLIA